MNIAIYDTEHFETTYTLIKLLDSAGHRVTVFTTEEIETILKNLLNTTHSTNFTWVVVKKTDFNNVFIINSYCKRNHIHLLILSTVAFHHLLFGILSLFLGKTKKLLTVHDANSFFKPRLTFHSRSILRFLGKKLLAASVNYYSTFLTTTKAFIEQEFRPAKPVICIPGSFFDEKIKPFKTSDQCIVIAIPGSVDTKRRNYLTLFEILSAWNKQGKRIEIVLLGGAKDEKEKEIIKSCKSLATEKLIVKVYDEPFVSQEEYEYQLHRCDFIYAPLKKIFIEESSHSEVYGLTKSSGSFFDAVRFGKPLLLPADIYLPSEIAQQCIVHRSTDELIHFINNLSSAQKEYYSQSAIKNSARFSIDLIRNRLNPLLEIETN